MLKEYWSKVGNIGLDKLKDTNEERNVILVNRISVVIALTSVIVVGVFFVGLPGRGWTLTRQLILAMGLFFMATPVLNYFGKFLIAKYIVSWVPLLFIISIAVYDKTLLPELYSLKDFFYYKYLAYTCTVFPFLIFNSQQKLQMGIGLLPSFVVLAFGDQIHNYFGVGLSDFGYETKHPLVFNLITIVSYFLIVVFVYNLRSVSDRFQGKINAQNRELAEQNAEIIAQAEELTTNNESLSLAYETIENQNSHLEQIVEEKTAHLKAANEQLTLQNNELSQFSFTVSHRLKSPIASILGLIQLIDKQGVSSENAVLVNHIEEMGMSMDELFHELNEILSLRTELHQKHSYFKIADEFQAQLEKVNSKMSTEGVEIVFNDLTSEGSIHTNQNKVGSIIWHLLSNAVKYASPQRNGKVELTVKEEDSSYLIRCWDNGLGIDLDTYGDKVFGIYQRFHTHTDGKGLGLYLVKAQAESLGGTATVSSKLNEFTQFDIKFNKSHKVLAEN